VQDGVDAVALPGLLLHQRAARETRWRSWRVASSGTQTSGMKSAAKSCARTSESTLSVLTLALAMARVRKGLETTTRPCVLTQ